MIAPRIASVVVALLVGAPVNLLAQQEPPVAPGDRVRVTAPTFTLLATVLASKPDTLVVGVGSPRVPLALPLASADKLEVRRTRSKSLTHILILGGVGFLLTAGVAELMTPNETTEYEQWLAVAGAGLGAFVGSLLKVKRWEEVPLDRLRVDVGAHRDLGLRISASVSL